MSLQQPVLEVTATYYKASIKKWITGIFILNPNSLQFSGDKPNEAETLLLPLSSICNLEKKQSSLIYPALTITIGAEKYWFASFANRDSIYNLIELFWRECLLSKKTKKKPHNYKEGTTPLGKELLNILQESENCLVDAANELAAQGRQLEESKMAMEDINSDLDGAEKYLRNMSFAQAILNLNEKDSGAGVGEEQKQQESLLKVFKVTFSDKGGDISDYKRGSLVIADKVVVLDQQKEVDVQFSKEQVERVVVISPWAFNLEYSSEWTTITINFICPQLSSMLKYLNSIPSLKDKIVYETELEECKGSSTSTNMQMKSLTVEDPKAPLDSLNRVEQQLQAQEENSTITTEEMEQINHILHNLKALATEVSREQHDQLEKINELISEVDETELRISSDNKTIKKAM